MEGSQKRGTKRKRFQAAEETQIAGKLHHHSKEVRKAAKKAKTFETQKLVKKLKYLRRKGATDPEVKEVEAQLKALKCIDHEPIANIAFKAKLNKDPILSVNDDVQAAIIKELDESLVTSVSPGSNAAKVQSRLLSSKTLSAQIATVIQDIKTFLQPEQTDGSVDGKDDDINPPPRKIKVDHGNVIDKTAGSSDISNSEQDEEDFDGDEKADEAGWESGSIHDADHETFANLDVGTGEGEDDSQNDDDESDDSLQVQRRGDVSNSRSKATGTQSTFLPSLAVGYIPMGSDESEWSDGDTNIVDGVQKKNRRGQRARRAIWEKKYGQNANHKKKKRELEKAAGSRPVNASRRPQPRQSTRDVPAHLTKLADSGWGQRSSHASAPVMTPGSSAHQTAGKQAETLHPSWEAKKKLKDRQGGILPSQGKKIKFS